MIEDDEVDGVGETLMVDGDEALPAAVLAAIRGGAKRVDETTDFRGFVDNAPASMPFDGRTALDDATRAQQAETGVALPFRRVPGPDDASELKPTGSPWIGALAAEPVATPAPVLPTPPAMNRAPAPLSPLQHVRPPSPLQQSAKAAEAAASTEDAASISTSSIVQDAASQHTPMQLIWYAKDAMSRIRAHEGWTELLDALDDRHDDDLDDVSYADEPGDLDDRREAFEVLARGVPSSWMLLPEVFADCAHEGGKYAPALVLLRGELELPFDAFANLRALRDAAAPFGQLDEGLAATLVQCGQFLETTQPPCGDEVCASWSRRIRDAFAPVSSMVSDGYLDDQAERVLLNTRAYQRRSLLGAVQLRAMLTPLDSAGQPKRKKSPIPAYLPSETEKVLPMFSRYTVRAIAELLPREDRYETHPAALRILALARELPLLSW